MEEEVKGDLEVELGEGAVAKLEVRPGDDPGLLAYDFALKHFPVALQRVLIKPLIHEIQATLVMVQRRELQRLRLVVDSELQKREEVLVSAQAQAMELRTRRLQLRALYRTTSELSMQVEDMRAQMMLMASAGYTPQRPPTLPDAAARQSGTTGSSPDRRRWPSSTSTPSPQRNSAPFAVTLNKPEWSSTGAGAGAGAGAGVVLDVEPQDPRDLLPGLRRRRKARGQNWYTAPRAPPPRRPRVPRPPTPASQVPPLSSAAPSPCPAPPPPPSAPYTGMPSPSSPLSIDVALVDATSTGSSSPLSPSEESPGSLVPPPPPVSYAPPTHQRSPPPPPPVPAVDDLVQSMIVMKSPPSSATLDRRRDEVAT